MIHLSPWDCDFLEWHGHVSIGGGPDRFFEKRVMEKERTCHRFYFWAGLALTASVVIAVCQLLCYVRTASRAAP